MSSVYVISSLDFVGFHSFQQIGIHMLFRYIFRGKYFYSI